MTTKSTKIAIIAGAGPAGLTAAYELLVRTDIIPVVIEQDDVVGGISRTVEYKGNRMDIGGHRFFSKSARVMNWWFSMLPLQNMDDGSDELMLRYQNRQTSIESRRQGPDPGTTDRVMLVRNRLSRIFYRRRFFDYPIRLNLNTILNLGLFRMALIFFSYLSARLFPVKPEASLEDFFINRFGRVLYRTFFKDYTEKVWGVPCRQIRPEWGAQRIKGLSVSRALWHALRSFVPRNPSVEQKGVETSLIEKFLYPKFGPGQMWQLVAERVTQMGGQIRLGCRVERVILEGGVVTAIEIREVVSGKSEILQADLFFSTMAVSDLISSMGDAVPRGVAELASGLMYRDFITVGLLLTKMKVKGDASSKAGSRVPDNWIYIQEGDVRVGRLQVFNNWSPWLVSDPKTVWLGMEYFCQEGDELWSMPDEGMIGLARAELVRIGLADPADFLDGVVVRMAKTYPAYFGTYDRFDEIRQFTDQISNLYLLGRNGMHRYNNQDHSMLTAMVAVDNLVAGEAGRANIWEVNTEEDYHEEQGS